MRISNSRSNSRIVASIAAALFGALLLLAAVPEFSGGAAWLNSAPLTPAALRGKVVLVDFWEYTCINCLRTLPYLREWYKRYRADGLVIIGVHTPEFAFSGDGKNVAAAVKRLGITWPVVLDDTYAIWKRYGNSVWPHEFLFDQSGNLVESQEGEGGYQQTEAKIQALLRAQHAQLHFPPVMPLLPRDSYDKPSAVCYPMTPETYVGPWHGQRVANTPVMANPQDDTLYRDADSKHDDGKIYLQGFWHVSPDGQAMNSSRGGDAARAGSRPRTYHSRWKTARANGRGCRHSLRCFGNVVRAGRFRARVRTRDERTFRLARATSVSAALRSGRLQFRLRVMRGSTSASLEVGRDEENQHE